jgi:hypothetical protein
MGGLSPGDVIGAWRTTRLVDRPGFETLGKMLADTFCA